MYDVINFNMVPELDRDSNPSVSATPLVELQCVADRLFLKKMNKEEMFASITGALTTCKNTP